MTTTAAAHPTPGTLLGPYEVLASLGAGGMGEVFRARDTRLGREVALKILSRAQLRDPMGLARFEAEARAVAALSHPNVRALYDLGQSGPTRFAVMELLEGQTLRARLFEGALPPRKALEYALAIAHGLAAAHDKGFVHRDLKPENVFLTGDGQVKILDFGLVQEQSPPGKPPATVPATVLGTAGYIAPEQARGRPADGRADIFAFGAVLYEMLSGRRAFSGDTPAAIMSAVVGDDPPPFSAVGARFPATLDRLVRRCLEKDPGERFQSARDLGYALEAAAASVATDSTAAARPALPRARRLAAGALLLALGTALGFGLSLRREPAPPAPQVVIRPLTHSGADHAPAASRDGRMLAFASGRDGRPRIWIKQLGSGSEAAVSEGPDQDPRFSPDGGSLLFTRQEGGSTALYRLPIVGGEPRRVVADASDGEWSPDGQRLAFLRHEAEGGRRASTLMVAAADGAGALALARFEQRVLRWPRWSPDGAALAVIDSGLGGGSRAVLLVDAAGGSWRALPETAGAAPMAASWLDAGRLAVTLARRGGGGRLAVQEVKDGALRPLIQLPGEAGMVDLLRPGRLVIESVVNRINLADEAVSASGSASRRWLTREHAGDRQPRHSPDGEWLAFSSNRTGNLDLWALSTRTGALRRLTEDQAEDWDPAFLADGRLLWSSGRSGRLELWMAEADGSGARQVTHDGHDAQNPTATPDGSWIVYDAANPARRGIWRVRPDGSEARRLVAGRTSVPEVSPDGRYVLYVVDGESGSASDSLRVAQLSDGQPAPFEVPLRRVRPAAVRLGRARWTPDGKAIAFVGQDEAGVHGVFLQDFVPGRDTSRTRRPLAGFDPDRETESFALAPSGRRVVVAGWERSSSVVMIEGLLGL